MYGLDMKDWPAIEQENFLYYVSLARRRGDLQDRSVFTSRLESALNAAFALDGRWVDRDQALESARVVEQHRRARALIERAYRLYDPVSDWVAFTEVLWAGRQWLFLEPTPR